MAVVGETITDDALFGIPEPDYGDDSDDDGKQQTITKQPITTTLSNDSNKSSGATTEHNGNIEQHSEEKGPRSCTDEESGGAQRTSFNSDDDDGKKYSDKCDETHSKHSPDVTDGALSLPLQDSNRVSGRRSPMSPIMGISNDHVAVDPVLIEAKKIPNVPQLTKEQKDLQKELQFKQKQGNMLEKKPELQKAMEDRKFKIKKEEQKRDQENKQSTLNVKLGQQAKKLMQLEEEQQKKKLSKTNSTPSEQQLDEFRKVHSKIHKNKS